MGYASYDDSDELYATQPLPKDVQSSPSHYSTSGVQVIDLIRDYGMAEDFCAGNVIKYVARYKKKDGLKDLIKARTYLNWLIDEVNK